MAVEKTGKDRRVQRTRALLHQALDSLVHEKPYDEIVVKEILERANVGRSTFYTHYRDKDELLVSSMHELLQAARGSGAPATKDKCEQVIRFSLPVFEHIHEQRHAGAARMGPKGKALVHEYLRKVLAERIAADVARAARGRRKTAVTVQADLMAQHLASTFVLVLNWWTESENDLRPAEVDALFRALVVPVLSGSLG